MKVYYDKILVELLYSETPKADSGSHIETYFSNDIPKHMMEPTCQQIYDEYELYQKRNAPLYKELLKQIIDSWDGVPGEW